MLNTRRKRTQPSPAEVTIYRNKNVPLEKKRCIHYFSTRGEAVYGYLEDLPSFLIGGLPKQGKTSAMVFYCCQIVSAGGQVILIDPHYGAPRDSLGKMVEPLSPWFALPVLNFNEVESSAVVRYFQYVLDEFLARKKPNGCAGKTALYLCVDEWNELLDGLDRDELETVLKCVRTVARSGRKYGMLIALAGQQWQLAVSGGSPIRKSVQGRISFNAEFSEIARVLDTRDTITLKSLVLPALKPGDAILKLPGSGMGILRVRFPYFNQDAASNIARIMRRVYGGTEQKTPYATTTEEIIENMQYVHEVQYISSPKLTEVSKDSKAYVSSPYNTCALTTDLPQNDISGEPVSGESFSTSIEPIKPSHNNFPLTTSFTSALPPEPRHSPQVPGPRVDNTNVSYEDRLLIIQAGNQQLAETGKVVRTKILEDLRCNTNDPRWNNKALWKVTAICDEMNWNARMSGKKELSTAEKQLLRQAAGSCAMCGSTEQLEVDHRWPKSLGGTLEPGNIQILCTACNRKKGASV